MIGRYGGRDETKIWKVTVLIRSLACRESKGNNEEEEGRTR